MNFGLHCKWSAQKKARPNKYFTFRPDFINPGHPLTKTSAIPEDVVTLARIPPGVG
jgi:hypothetical protein